MTSPAGGRAIVYWICTAFVAVEFTLGGVWDVFQVPYVDTVMKHLGYPGYFTILLGVWKLAAAVALLVPGVPRLKEWAYAGMVFSLTGAIASHLAVGDRNFAVAYLIIVTGLTVVSRALRPATRRGLLAEHLHRVVGPSTPSGRSRSSIAYWITTLLLATECVVGGVMGAVRYRLYVEIITHLGYPTYFMTILSFWYVLAGLALLAPRLPLVKEWAYAGLIFNYTGAVVSHLASSDGAESLVGPIMFACLAVASWALRPSARWDLIASVPRPGLPAVIRDRLLVHQGTKRRNLNYSS